MLTVTLALNVLGDVEAHLKYSTDQKSYDGNFALFFQQLSIAREGIYTLSIFRTLSFSSVYAEYKIS